MNKLTEPNYEILFKSSVEALKIAFINYKKAVTESIKWQFIDDNGNYCILSGYEDRMKNVEKSLEEVHRISADVEYYRNKLNERDISV